VSLPAEGATISSTLNQRGRYLAIPQSACGGANTIVGLAGPNVGPTFAGQTLQSAPATYTYTVGVCPVFAAASQFQQLSK
jgi:hypothetical protein